MKLEFDHVSKRYGKKEALKGFSGTLIEGVYGLLGPNGAGKSTLMNILTGNLSSTTGEIYLDGQKIRSLEDKYYSRIGYMPQQDVFFPSFTAEHFLYYMASLRGMETERAGKRVETVLKELSLWDVRDMKIRQLSGGMKRRLLLCQAIIHEPDILIMDEPTTGLDPKQRITVRNLIAEFAKGRIVILSTHIVADVEYIAKELLFLSRGELIQRGTPTFFTDNLRGRIWETTIAAEMLPELEKEGTVMSVYKGGDSVTVRLMTKEGAQIAGYPVQPTLEDVYLSFFKDDEI